MSVAADLDALIADFGQYGDLITTGDSVDRLQRVIIAFSDGTLQPPNDALGNDSMVWLCKLIKYLEANLCPALGPELIPAGAVFVDDGSGGGIYHINIPDGNYLVTPPVPGGAGQAVAGSSSGGARLTWTNIASLQGFANSVSVKSTSGVLYIFGGAIGSPVLFSVKQIL